MHAFNVSYSVQTENQKWHLKLIKLNYDRAKLVPEHFYKLFSEITEVIWRICKVNLYNVHKNKILPECMHFNGYDFYNTPRSFSVLFYLLLLPYSLYLLHVYH